MYAKGMNDLSAEADRLLTERDSISYTAKTDIAFIEEAKELLDYTDGATMLTGFDADVFERFVDRIVVRDRHHLEFEMKCGLKLTERI
ncbi:MAG: recombinase family protein, partial [Lachnospiraceae bacterium]|nr:recombinase family protein [Lachnospiraceae bacterium]